MKRIKYQREIPAVIEKDADGNEVITSYAHLREEECRFIDADKDRRIAEALKYAYNGEYTIEDIPTTAEEARAQRDKLLAESDWTQTLDAPIDEDTKTAYRVYRQALRDIPQQEGFPETIVWPELPTKVKADPDPVDDAVDLLLSGATGEEADE